MACECTLRGPAEGKVHLALPMQVLVQSDDTLTLPESSMLFTEMEAEKDEERREKDEEEEEGGRNNVHIVTNTGK